MLVNCIPWFLSLLHLTSQFTFHTPVNNDTSGNSSERKSLVVHDLPEHERRVGAAHGDDVAVVEEEPGRRHGETVHLLLVVLRLRAEARVPEDVTEFVNGGYAKNCHYW